MEGRLDLLASLEEEGEQMLNTQPEGSQEVVRSQGKEEDSMEIVMVVALLLTV